MRRIGLFISDMFRHWVGIMTGAMSILLSVAPLLFPSWFAGDRGLIHQKAAFWGAAIVCVLVASYSAWNEAKAETDSMMSKLSLFVPGCLHCYDSQLKIHIFVLAVEIGNAGAPTLVRNWRAHYLCAGSREPMTGFFINQKYGIRSGDEIMTFQVKHQIQSILSNVQLGRKDGRAGRLLVTMPGDRTDQVRACQYQVLIECEDFDGNVCACLWTPHPQMLDSIKFYPHEDPPTHLSPQETLIESAQRKLDSSD